MLQAPPFVHRHFHLPVAGIAGLKYLQLKEWFIQSSPKSLGELPKYIQLPTPFLADTSNEEGDGIGEAGGDGGNAGEPEEIRGVMAEVVGELLTESEGRTIAVYAAAVPHNVVAVLQVPTDTPCSSS